MKDSDKIPFGKHKGTPIGEVPADYLDWLIDQPWMTAWPDIERYIISNRKVINMELTEQAQAAQKNLEWED